MDAKKAETLTVTYPEDLARIASEEAPCANPDTCTNPGCGVQLSCNEHPEAPVTAVYARREHALLLQCSVCAKWSWAIALSPAPDEDPPSTKPTRGRLH